MSETEKEKNDALVQPPASAPKKRRKKSKPALVETTLPVVEKPTAVDELPSKAISELVEEKVEVVTPVEVVDNEKEIEDAAETSDTQSVTKPEHNQEFRKKLVAQVLKLAPGSFIRAGTVDQWIKVLKNNGTLAVTNTGRVVFVSQLSPDKGGKEVLNKKYSIRSFITDIQ